MYKAFNNFILRSPLKPFNYLEYFLEQKKILKLVVKDKILIEAIYIASPNLHSKILKFNKGEITDKKEIRKIEIAIFKYISRLSYRCTPFGIFAGVSIGNFSNKTKINLPTIENNRKFTRLDMNFLVEFSNKLSEIPEIKDQLNFYPNNSLYQDDKEYKYVEYNFLKRKRKYNFVSVDKFDTLKKILNFSKNGATIFELANSIIDNNVKLEEAKLFINELIKNQILVSELEPNITGDFFFDKIIHKINKLKEIDSLKNNIINLKKIIDNIKISKIGINNTEYNLITSHVKKTIPNIDTSNLFHVNLFKPTKPITLDQKISQNILEGIKVLCRLSSNSNKTNLNRFKDAFIERYGNEEIPLLKALDVETGILYIQNNKNFETSSSLIKDLDFPILNKQKEKINDISNPFIKKIYIEALKENKYEIVITDSEINEFTEEPIYNLPLTFYVIAQIFNNYEKENTQNIYINTIGGSSAINLISSQAHINNDIKKFIKEITVFEEKEKQDKIFAEIIHLPKSKSWNFLVRPSIRKYEIPYLAKSSVNNNFIIYPKDLTISVKKDKIVLKSKKLNKEIIPTLGNAHNYINNELLPVYQFLCDLQTQNSQLGISFNWGHLINDFTFFPRVRYKNVILSFAKWKIFKKGFNQFINIKNDTELITVFKQWRTNNKIPTYVLLEEGDNKLALKLNNLISIKTLISLVKNKPFFILSELLLNSKSAFIKNKDGYFANEFIFAFKNLNQ